MRLHATAYCVIRAMRIYQVVHQGGAPFTDVALLPRYIAYLNIGWLVIIRLTLDVDFHRILHLVYTILVAGAHVLSLYISP